MLKLVSSWSGYLMIESVATDLESFASHAKRSIINVEDVKVFCNLCCGIDNSYVVEGMKDWCGLLKGKS